MTDKLVAKIHSLIYHLVALNKVNDMIDFDKDSQVKITLKAIEQLVKDEIVAELQTIADNAHMADNHPNWRWDDGIITPKDIEKYIARLEGRKEQDEQD